MNRRLYTRIVVVALLLVASVTSVVAGITNQPPPIPGWTHQRFPVDTPEGHGIVLDGNVIEYGSPVIAEVDGNLQNGKEVVIAGKDGRLYAYQANGRLLWQKQPNELFPNGCGDENTQRISSKPAVGQLYGDGVNYVVVGLGPVVDTNPVCDGGVVAIDGRNGNIRWHFSSRNWLASQGRPAELNASVLSSPALADTDGDGLMEIGFGGLDRYIYLLSASRDNQGYQVRWFYNAADSVWSSPAFADVNGDGQLELIIGADISANPFLRPPTEDGGYIYAFDTQARNPRFVDFQDPESFIWRTFFDQVIYSSPAIGDVLSNNPGLEVVIGSGCNFPAGRADKRGKWVKILSLSTGNLLQTLNLPPGGACVQSSPALGDIDGDGKLEVVVGSGWKDDTGSDGKSRVVAWDPENSNPKWATILIDANSDGAQQNNAGDVNLNSPVIADVDGNGSLEVLFADFWSVHVLDGNIGKQLTSSRSSDNLTSLFAWRTLFSTPAVGDLTGDGVLDVVIGGGVFPGNLNNRGMLYGWTNLAGRINSPAGNLAPYSSPWPQLRGNAANTAVLIEPRIVSSLTSASALITPQDSREFFLRFSNSASNTLNWRVRLEDANSILSLNRTSGSSADELIVTVNANRNLTLGQSVYRANLIVEADGLPSISIPFNVRVVENLFIVYQPLVIR